MLLLENSFHFHMVINKLLTDWYLINKRDLPWREKHNAYEVWLSEIILQQTRINQGLDYYYRFIGKYPTIFDLACAREDEVLKLWQGLGYYSRARNLLKTAKIIAANFNGVIPNDYKTLIKLKGIGDYTASAILSIAYNQSYPTVDGNVYRVIARLYNIDIPVNSTQGSKLIKEIANKLLNKNEPGIHNQAMMEFGSLQCIPQNPDCGQCVLKGYCEAYKSNTVNLLPIKEKKTKTRNRYFNYFFIRHGINTCIQKRKDNDIWKNLYEFPLIESNVAMEFDNLQKTNEWNELFGDISLQVQLNTKSYVHVLSHQKINAVFYQVKIDKPIGSKCSFEIAISNLGKYAIPRLIEKYLKEINEDTNVGLADD